jgi:hypothetical protein
VQEELASLIVTAGVTLVKGTNTQLLGALRALFVDVANTQSSIGGLKTFIKKLTVSHADASTPAISGTASGGGAGANGVEGTGVIGVKGTGGTYGVQGTGTTGVQGTSSDSAGVEGTATSGATAVNGAASGSGYAGDFSSSSGTGYGLRCTGNATRAAFRMTPQSEPSSGIIGDMFMNAIGELRVCTATGTPGTWVLVGSQNS